MSTITLLSIFAFIIYLCLGIPVFSIEIKSKTHRLFFYMCLSLALWAMCLLFVSSSDGKDFLLFWFKLGFVAALFFFSFTLHFYLVLTNVIKIKHHFYYLLYLPTFVLLYRNFTSLLLYKDFLKINNQWVFVPNYDSIWTYVYLSFNTSYMIFCIILSIIWRVKARTIREKKISVLHLTTLLICLILGSAEFLAPKFIAYKSRGPSPIFFVLWMFGIFYTIIRYRFMTITPELVSKDIIENIDELIILLDQNLEVITVNNKAENIINYQLEELRKISFANIIKEKEIFSNELNNIINNKYKDFSCRLHFIKKEGKGILVDAKCSIIKDKIGDFLGILIIGGEVKEEKQFKEVYKITERQADIIQYIISGKTNKEIALLLNVAERTIKGHITNIYYKLDVSNKMQLLNLLKRFNLVSERDAEKTLILLKKK